MNPAQMAGGGGMPPPQQAPQPPQTGQQTQTTPDQTQMGDPRKVLDALKAAIEQCVNQQGYVDINKLVMLWPQVSQKFGINIPFQTVMQMIQQNPNLIEDIINQMGLAGIIKDGQVMSPEQILGQATGATAGG